MDKINKSLQDAVYVAETHWKKSITEHNEFWGTFDKNIFQSLAEVEHLEQIIAAALQRKVVATDKDFTRIFFENDQIKEHKKYILIVALINYLELIYHSLATITKGNFSNASRLLNYKRSTKEGSFRKTPPIPLRQDLSEY